MIDKQQCCVLPQETAPFIVLRLTKEGRPTREIFYIGFLAHVVQEVYVGTLASDEHKIRLRVIRSSRFTYESTYLWHRIYESP